MRERRTERMGYLFILPFFLFLVLFSFYPLINTLVLSFHRYDGLLTFKPVGIKHYAGLITDSKFWTAFISTWQIWLPNILMQLALAFLVSVLFTEVRLKVKGVGFFRAVFFFPNLVTAASIALLVNVMLDWKHGALNQMLFGDNIEAYINWWKEPARAQFIVSIIQTWLWFGYTAIILTTGIQGIPRTYYEAAYVDGASSWQIFWKITMPLLAPIVTYVVITSLIGGMQIFDIPYILRAGLSGATGTALTTMVVYLYDMGFRFHRMGYAAAVSYMLFFLIVALSLIYFFLTRERKSGENKK
ncbi:sugar ABC transporter permease [Spirochaetia bacterium 38H-sp]|uniref:Sugar ABC transporter permease n=1 Tax=Rarispira pelagica TaxID=3141764 RepID=A0ABU9UAC1_9SPIR